MLLDQMHHLLMWVFELKLNAAKIDIIVLLGARLSLLLCDVRAVKLDEVRVGDLVLEHRLQLHL